MENTQRFKLGLFVLIAFTLMIAGLYYIGSKRNIFHRTITVNSTFNNVNGLLTGNNVRFNGINIGTVSAITAVSDSAVRVDFTIDKTSIAFISQNAFTSIGTDGLLGNKLINIHSKKSGPPIAEGCQLIGLPTLSLDPTMRSLTATSENTRDISEEIKQIAGKINHSESLWNILSDSLLSNNLSNAIDRFKDAGSEAARFTQDLSSIASKVKNGEGSAGKILMNNELSERLNSTLSTFRNAGDTLAAISGKLSNIAETIQNGKGTVGMLLQDTLVENQLRQSIQNAERGVQKFDASMNAIQHSWLIRGFLKKQKKRDKTIE